MTKRPTPNLMAHSTPPESRVYPAHAVNLSDMRFALQRLLGWLEDGSLQVEDNKLDMYGEQFLKAKIRDCELVIIDRAKRSLFIRTHDPEDNARYQYSASLPQGWPT